MRRLVMIMTGALVLAGCGGGEPETEPAVVTATTTPTPTPDIITITGEIAISQYDSSVTGSNVLDATEGQSCTGDGGYDDIRAGAQVVVTSDGETVAVGELAGGRIRRAGADCWFGFSVEDVPGDRGFYSVEVAGRGELTYPRDEIATPLKLTLG